ncbi:precorrin-3B C(17)-methyltransferase [bacterium SCSIO 12827]|nr:precorrin-3B C(17)-methyltransferase [bacterium SCSIO 12827]
MTAAPPVILAVTEPGTALARRLQSVIPGALVHGRVGRVAEADDFFDETTSHAARLFQAGHPVIGIFASGILIRALAPLLANKVAEPPVISVAEDGSAVVPLLGGHSGANVLAREIAKALGISAAVTTTGDLRHGIGVDDPPAGWMVANRKKSLPVAAALLAGDPVRLNVQAGDASWLTDTDLPIDPSARPGILVTDRAQGDTDDLVLHPPVLVIGVGCERDADPAEVRDLVTETLAKHRLAPGAVACVATIDVKMDEAAVNDLGDVLSVPVRFFDAATLEAETPRLANPSDVVFQEVGCHGVAEGAALAAAGPTAELIVEKSKSKRATCAIARASGNIDASAVGRARGRLTVVGTGPGAPLWRTPAVSRAVAGATDLVGYGLYLDLLGPAAEGKALHSSDLSEEEARARKALDLAAEGRQVALVCSGDPGVYALATLVVELIDRGNDPRWNRLAVTIEPGVSALQAAAARAGAPLGHDFCAVSLSDLLTPWEVIEKRLRAAAEGDFVMALYNPVSKRRRWQLEKARDILMAHRPPETPVILARNLGRDGETIQIIDLKDLTADMVDMLTLVMIGSSDSRAITRGTRRWVYTPRGYAGKMQKQETGT